jgi:hypothetical protein
MSLQSIVIEGMKAWALYTGTLRLRAYLELADGRA